MHIKLPSNQMHRKLVLLAALVFVVGCIGGAVLWQRSHAPSVAPEEDEASEYLEGRRHEAIVWIKADGYLPSTVRIHRDTAVFLENHDTVTHRIVFTPGGPKPEHFDETHDIEPGKQYGARFMQDGTYHYHDPLNPKFNGTIIVSGK